MREAQRMSDLMRGQQRLAQQNKLLFGFRSGIGRERRVGIIVLGAGARGRRLVALPVTAHSVDAVRFQTNARGQDLSRARVGQAAAG